MTTHSHYRRPGFWGLVGRFKYTITFTCWLTLFVVAWAVRS